MPRIRIDISLTVANVIGVVAYLALASLSWVNPAERDLGLLGEPYIWVLGAFRVLVLFLLINVVWGIAMLIKVRWRSGRLYASVWLVWIVAVLIDFSLH